MVLLLDWLFSKIWDRHAAEPLWEVVDGEWQEEYWDEVEAQVGRTSQRLAASDEECHDAREEAEPSTESTMGLAASDEEFHDAKEEFEPYPTLTSTTVAQEEGSEHHSTADRVKELQNEMQLPCCEMFHGLKMNTRVFQRELWQLRELEEDEERLVATHEIACRWQPLKDSLLAKLDAFDAKQQAFRHLGSILAPLRQEQEDLKRRLEDAGGLERAALEAQLKRIEDTTILLSAWELALSEMKVARNKAHNAAEQLAEALAVELRGLPTAAPAEQWTAAAGEVEPATLTDRRLRVPVRLVYDSPVSSLSSQMQEAAPVEATAASVPSDESMTAEERKDLGTSSISPKFFRADRDQPGKEQSGRSKGNKRKREQSVSYMRNEPEGEQSVWTERHQSERELSVRTETSREVQQNLRSPACEISALAEEREDSETSSMSSRAEREQPEREQSPRSKRIRRFQQNLQESDCEALQRIKLGLGGLLRQLRAMREMEATERQETRWEVEQQWPPLKARLQEQMEDIMSKRMAFQVEKQKLAGLRREQEDLRSQVRARKASCSKIADLATALEAAEMREDYLRGSALALEEIFMCCCEAQALSMTFTEDLAEEDEAGFITVVAPAAERPTPAESAELLSPQARELCFEADLPFSVKASSEDEFVYEWPEWANLRQQCENFSRGVMQSVDGTAPVGAFLQDSKEIGDSHAVDFSDSESLYDGETPQALDSFHNLPLYSDGKEGASFVFVRPILGSFKEQAECSPQSLLQPNAALPQDDEEIGVSHAIDLSDDEDN